jgi:hypothetical protein
MMMASTAPDSLTVKTYDGATLGVISLNGEDLTGSTPATQDMADSWLQSGKGTAAEVLKSRDGWQNGYLFASSDPAAAVA